MLIQSAALVLWLHTSACGSTPAGTADAGGGAPDARPPTSCSPRSCPDVGAECGVIDDGCGGVASCGGCTGDEMCGGGGSANLCETCSPGAWAIEEVLHAGQAWGFALAVDASGTAHLAYTRRDPQEVRYGQRRTDGTWMTELVRPAAHLGDLVAEADGSVHIAMTTEDNVLAFSHRDPIGTWKHSDYPGAMAGGGTVLALDANGALHAAYGSDQLNYIVNSGTNWSQPTQLLAEPSGQGVFPTALEVDSQGRVHVVVREYQNLENTELFYLTGSGAGPWELGDLGPLAGSSGRTVSFALDHDDGAHFLDGVIHHHKEGDSWSAERADPELNTGGASAMSFDGQGNLHISYSQYTTYELKYALLPSGGSWAPTSVDGLGWVGTSSTIEVDSDGGVHILYSDQGEGTLRYAYRCP